ncbi:MAG TPA: tetraacyldisaccharide 4'-kinase [Usitatibacteraceae bacterium]
MPTSSATLFSRAWLESWLTREWQRNSWWQLLLRPLSWLFALGVALRRWSFRLGLRSSTRIDAPVIIVGNITVGGSGKTPLVLALVEMLRTRGYRPGVVSRGYGSNRVVARSDPAIEVDVARPDAAAVFGDEPLLLAGRLGCPVFIGRDRAVAARALRKRHPEVDVVIGDDGLQHYALARDIEIAVLDGSQGVGNGVLLPAGPLREPVSRLESVDAIAVYGNGRSFGGRTLPTFAISLGAERLINLRSGQQLGVAEFIAAVGGKRIHALAGIARPQRFFAHLQRLGLRTNNHPFADHHRFSAGDLALPDGDLILMTEKDAVKCMAFADARCWYLRVDAELPAAFHELILQRLRSIKSRRH